MKNLFDKLKPEALELLMAQAILFPFTIEQIILQLQNNTHLFALKYQTICDIVIYLDLESYSPSTIDKLFFEYEVTR